MNKIILTMSLIILIFTSIGCSEKILTSENQVEPSITSITDFSQPKTNKIIVDGQPYDLVYNAETISLNYEYEYEFIESTKIGVTDNDVEISKIVDAENNNTIYIARMDSSISISVVTNT